MNPWKILFEWADALVRRLGVKSGLELGEPYPTGWGVWPAVGIYPVFIWVENIFWGSAIPADIALLTLLYSIPTWGGMVVFGKEVWLRNGEMFSVFFNLLAKFAPTEVRVTDPEICRNCGNACGTVKGDCVICYECFASAYPEQVSGYELQ